jgi:hypothetical protein
MNAEAPARQNVLSDQPTTLVMDPNIPQQLGDAFNATDGDQISSAQTPNQYDDELTRNLNINIVDASSGVINAAADHADVYLAEQTTQNGFKGFIKKIWHGNLARDYIRIRQVQSGRERIIESGNLGELRDSSLEEHDREMSAVVGRFANDYLHSGESRTRLNDTDAGTKLEQELRVLVNFYANNEIDADTLQEEKTRILDSYKNTLHEDDRNKGLLLADNVLEVAQNAKAAFNHGVGMDRIQQAISTEIGEARIGQRTEARRDLTDKVVDKLYSTKAGSLVNETTIALAAGVTIAAVKLSTRKAVTAATATVGMGVGAGIMAGAREHARIGNERQQHIRERAAGMETPEDGAKRRQQLEETRYQTVAASELAEQLEQARAAVNDADPSSIADAFLSISEAQSRIRMSDEKAIDLVDFDSNISIEQERLKLDIALAGAKVAARKALEGADDGELQAVGLSKDFDSILKNRLEGIHDLLNDDIDVKDAAFAKLRRKQTLKMGLIGMVSGLALGEAMQEVRASLTEGLHGVLDGKDVGHADRQTILSALAGHHGIHTLHDHVASRQHFKIHETGLNHNGSLDLPANYHLHETSPDHWELNGNKGQPLVGNLSASPHGQLTEASQEALRNTGFHLHEQTQHYVTKALETHKVARDPREYLSHHPGQFTKVQREAWYDNNTPNVFDQNELKLLWGGHDGTGTDAHGNIVFNVAHMTPDGSFNGDLSANAQQLIHEGKMSIALSMTKGTQNHVIMVRVDSQGNAIINSNSWVAHSLFTKSADGQMEFKGAYAEAVQLMGKQNGIEHMRMLATVVGSNDPNHITDTIHTLVPHEHERIITHLSGGPRLAETNLSELSGAHLPVEISPVLPLYGRSGLETSQESNYSSNPDAYPGLFSYLGSSPYVPEGYRDTDNLLSRRGLSPYAPELEQDPSADINAEVSARRYARSHRPSYRRILESLENNLSKEPKSTRPKVVVMIPAAAHQEGKNIHNTLMQYAHQEDVESNDYEVVVFANYPEDAQPDQTIEEVRRFQKENPAIKVRLIEKKLTKAEQNIGWIRKAATDTAITDLMERGVPLNDVLLVSNDADSEWINPKYLRTIIDKAEASPTTDGFLGFIDWGYDAYKAHPEVLVSTRFMQMMETYLRVAKHEIGSSGANFAFRPSIYTAVGGYRPDSSLGEDVLLGRMIRSVRAGAETRRPIGFLGRSSEVNTSARRALEKLFKDGGAPATQWNDGFGVNDELRTRTYDLPEFDYSDEAAVADMVSDAQRMINQTLNVYSASLETERISPYHQGRLMRFDADTVRQLDRLFFFLGIVAKWQPDGTIEISDSKTMVNGLKKWQARH